MDKTLALRAYLPSLLAGVAMFSMASVASAQSADQLAKADGNGDGSVTKQELLDMRAKNFGRLDRNGDGFADANDSPSMGPLKKAFQDAWTKAKAADANGDGRVSKAEMIGAPTPAFDAADKDKNGILSKEEMAALRASGG